MSFAAGPRPGDGRADANEFPGYRVGRVYFDSDNGMNLMVCLRCGSIVGSIPDHDAWHEHRSV